MIVTIDGFATPMLCSNSVKHDKLFKEGAFEKYKPWSIFSEFYSTSRE